MDQTMTHPHPLPPQPLSQRFLQLLAKPEGKKAHRAPVCTAPCSHRQLEAPHSHRQGGTSLRSVQKMCVCGTWGNSLVVQVAVLG